MHGGPFWIPVSTGMTTVMSFSEEHCDEESKTTAGCRAYIREADSHNPAHPRIKYGAGSELVEGNVRGASYARCLPAQMVRQAHHEREAAQAPSGYGRSVVTKNLRQWTACRAYIPEANSHNPAHPRIKCEAGSELV